ncbi:MAG: IS3 family transposase [Clostridia bacterium]|nr:IS3 family transposase [Clostridia bacterium]
MAKYSFEFKQKVVMEYLNGEGGYEYLGKKYSTRHCIIEKWVANYKQYGDEGLKRIRRNQSYTFEFKLHVVELYLTSELSYKELALQVGMRNPAQITRWVLDYRAVGPEALKPKKKGQKRSMDKDKIIHDIENGDSEEQKKLLKQLQDENLKLRIENAFLKELRRLRLEEEAHLNELRESSTASEEKFKLKDILAVIGFPKSTYMYWQKRFDREDPDAEILKKIQDIKAEHKDYGYRRLCGELRKQGLKINKKCVQRIVQKYGMQVTSYTRKSRRFSTYKGVIGRIAPNRINRRFNSSVPHQKITTDTSEFKYYETDSKGRVTIKKLYLDPFMDLWNLEILSYGVSERPSAKSIMDAQQEAIAATSDCRYRRTFHSDRGWAYQMPAYQYELKKNHIFQSMSRKGNCYDNSPMENFFGIMKQEMYYGKVYTSYDELKEAIDKYIRYYNEKRIKASLGYRSPVEYRECMMTA